MVKSVAGLYKHMKDGVLSLTNTLVDIPWVLEIIWAILTPKIPKSSSPIKKIVLCCFYSPPNSNARYKLVDHICGIYHQLSAKYGQGLHFIIAGDANDMKLDSILQLSSGMRQVVNDFTRLNPPALLVPIITSLGNY